MFEDMDFGGGGEDVLGDFIGGQEATGWDGNWTGGEDFLGALDQTASSFGDSGGSGGGALSSYSGEGSPNVNSVSEADMGVKAGIGQSSASEGGGAGGFAKVARAMGLTDKNGSFDWSDPKTLDKLLKLGIGVGGIMQSLNANKQAQAQQQQQLQQQLQQQAKQQWTPQQAQWANNFFQNPTNPNRGVVRAGEGGIQSIVPSRGYAEGGPVEAPPEGFDVPEMDHPLGLLEGPGTGQSDSLPIAAARGEYIVDADSVAAIGDGSNAAGAERLDAWIKNIREQKRAAPTEDIPPPLEQSMNLDSYVMGGQ
jgi:hypothetical protein